MNGTSALIFAKRNDYLALSGLVESKLTFTYSLSGNFPAPETKSYTSISMLPDLGTCPPGDWVHANRFLVAKPDHQIEKGLINLRRGGVSYAFDIIKNPYAFIFTSGGLYDENTLICGAISRATGNAEATANYDAFRRLMGKVFRRVRGDYVGPEAYEMLLNGARLVQQIRQPTSSDLRLE
ncbi:MAG TPA: hypothetical protein VGK19_11615 [Capsulimonadaceae bacterium]|jgi:hypothetical protein